MRRDCEKRPLRVCTNNIIVYVLLLFAKHVEPVLLPGDPSNSYGATFGRLHRNDACDSKAVMEFLKQNNVKALFTTASFLDLQYGPHVGTEPNHQIKRTLNEYAAKNGCAHFFVIAAEKITNDVTDKKLATTCKLIFDDTGNHENPQAKEKARNGWHDFMSNEKNFIITGSARKTDQDGGINGSFLANLKEKFISERPHCNPYVLPFDDGELLTIQGGNGHASQAKVLSKPVTELQAIHNLRLRLQYRWRQLNE